MARRAIIYSSWLKQEFQRTGRSKGDLAKALNARPEVVSRLLSGERDLSAAEYEIARKFFGTDASEYRDANSVRIDEIDVRAGAGGGGQSIVQYEADGDGGTVETEQLLQQWYFPVGFVHNELRVSEASLHVVQVMGDSMEPTLKAGDRILVDTSHRNPSPPGIYAVWDGLGVVVKRVEIVPRTDPMQVRLISDNPRHASYTVTLEEAHIIGRVVCKISTM